MWVRAALLAATLGAPEAVELPWWPAHERAAERRNELAARTGALLAELRRRALAEDPAELRRLRKVPEAARPTGYGLLPEVERERKLSPGQPWESCYDLAELEAWIGRELLAAAALEREVRAGTIGLREAVGRFLELQENANRIDQHVSYHEFWQKTAAQSREFFRSRNRLLADWRLAQAPARDESARRAAAQARNRVEADLLGFHRLAGPILVRHGDGSQVLHVKVATDIEDERFLRGFADSIERNWNRAAAMRAARLRIELEWDRRSPAALYPEGPPRRGEAIDLAAHRARFGAAPLVLSTGAASTHAVAGAVFLGTAPVTPRTLAHEFGHLLGFTDGYLRGYLGSTEDALGVVFVEVGPFPESLMASPGTGRVTAMMVRQICEGYGGRPEP